VYDRARLAAEWRAYRDFVSCQCNEGREVRETVREQVLCNCVDTLTLIPAPWFITESDMKRASLCFHRDE
jgi:hypothetical protein